MKWRQGRVKREPLLALAILALITLALWLPVGLTVRGTIEELLIREQFLVGVPVWEVGGHALRPLAYLPFYLGYLTTPESFVGLNLLHMVAVWGKGAALFLLLRQLGATGAMALGSAVVFVLFPADDGQLTLRTTAIQVSVALFVCAVYLLLRFAHHRRTATAAGAVVCLAAGLSIYEAAAPLAAVAPALLLFSADRRRAVIAAIVWYATLAAVGIRYVVASLTAQDSYQQRVMVADRDAWWIEAPAYFAATYRRIFVDGWIDGLYGLPAADRLDLLVAVLLAVAVGAVLVVLSRAATIGPPADDRRRLVALAAAGIVVVAVGFSAYLPTSIRSDTWRTLMLPSLGGALAITAALRVVLPRSRGGDRLFAAAIALLAGVGFTVLAAQHRFFASVSSAQERVVDGILAAAPELSPHAQLLLLFDETETARSTHVFPFSRYLRASLYPHYRHADLNVHICQPWESRGESCRFEGDRVEVAHPEVGRLQDRLNWSVSYDAVVAVHQDHRGNFALLDALPSWLTLAGNPARYDPHLLVDRGSGFVSPQGGVVREFGSDGGIGAGWSAPRETAAGLTYRFLRHHRGALRAPLDVADYGVEIHLANLVRDDLAASLSLTVGDEDIPLERIGPAVFLGSIPSRLIERGRETTLIFAQDEEILAAVQAERGPLLGLGFDSVRLRPLTAPLEGNS